MIPASADSIAPRKELSSQGCTTMVDTAGTPFALAISRSYFDACCVPLAGAGMTLIGALRIPGGASTSWTSDRKGKSLATSAASTHHENILRRGALPALIQVKVARLSRTGSRNDHRCINFQLTRGRSPMLDMDQAKRRPVTSSSGQYSGARRRSAKSAQRRQQTSRYGRRLLAYLRIRAKADIPEPSRQVRFSKADFEADCYPQCKSLPTQCRPYCFGVSAVEPLLNFPDVPLCGWGHPDWRGLHNCQAHCLGASVRPPSPAE